MEKDRTRYCNYKFHLEIAEKVHESFKKRKKNYDHNICWNDWDILWMDDSNMNDSRKNEIMDLIEVITSKLMVVNERSKSRLFTIKKTLDSTDPHHPMYADLVKESEKQEIFFEKVYTITDLSNRIIEDFERQSNSKLCFSDEGKKDRELLIQQYDKLMKEIKQE